MNNSWIKLICILFFLININLYSKVSSGAGNFLRQYIGVRPMAMGNAFVAVSDDVSAFYHNPSGIMTLNWAYISVNFKRFLDNQYLGSIIFVDSSSNEEWAYGISFHSSHFLGLHEYDNNGNKISKLSNYNILSYFTLATQFGKSDFIKIGINAKFIYRDLAKKYGIGGGLDIGLLLVIPWFNVGVMLQDLVSIVKFSSRNTLIHYDRILKIGLATNLSYTNLWKLSIQLDKNLSSLEDDLIFRIGAYFRLWQKYENNYSNVNKKNSNLDELIKTPKKKFKDALYLNVGYGNKAFSLGITLKLIGIKMDLSASLSEFDLKKLIFGAAFDFSLY